MAGRIISASGIELKCLEQFLLKTAWRIQIGRAYSSKCITIKCATVFFFAYGIFPTDWDGSWLGENWKSIQFRTRAS